MGIKNQLIYRIILILAFFVQSLTLTAQLQFEQFSNKEGFNQNSTLAIEQDRYGNLWFATTNGLVRYDGYAFKDYANDEDAAANLWSNYITSLHNDDKGILWIGTTQGVSVYIPWLEKFFKIPSTENINVQKIKSDLQQGVWIAGHGGIFKISANLKKDEPTFLLSKNILSREEGISMINDFHFAENKTMLLVTTSGIRKLTFNDFDTSKPVLEKITSFESFHQKNVTVIAQLNNLLWLGTTHGIYKATLEDDRIHIVETYYTEKGKDNTHILSLFKDNTGNLWFGTLNKGVLRYNVSSDSFDSFPYHSTSKNGVSSRRINCFFQDDYNVLWIGTAQGGLNKLDLMQKPFFNYSSNPYDKTTISDNLINAILEDANGFLWIAGHNKSICRSTHPVNKNAPGNLEFQNLQKQFSLLENEVILCVYEDKKDYIWFGTNYSVFVYNPENQSINKVFFASNTRRKIVRIISQIDEETILFGGNALFTVKTPWSALQKGSNQFDISHVEFPQNAGLVQAFLKDSKENLWLGTKNNLLRGRKEDGDIKIEKLNSTEHKEHTTQIKNVFSLNEDHEGNILVGTFGLGLEKVILDGQGKIIGVKHYRKSDLLPDNTIYGIIRDNQNHFWLSTNMGLCRTNSNLSASDIINIQDGLPHNNFRQGAYHKGHSGMLYFGGLNGLTIFNPETIELNSIPPKVLISSLSVNNEVVGIGDKNGDKHVLSKSISETEHLTFTYKERIITFGIVIQHSSAPLKNSLSYKLEGFDTEWIEEGVGKTTLTYMNLPAGEYTFKVQGKNGDGLQSEQFKAIAITILPPWYNTWWFYLCLSIVLLLVVAGIFRYFIKWIKLKQELRFEQLDKERIDTSNKSKLLFFTNISHEFRTPLTLIAGPLERIITRNPNSEDKKNLTIIQNNTNKLLLLVDQLISFRKIEEGYAEVNFTETTLGNFIYTIAEAFEDFSKRKNINFFYKVSSPNEKVIIDVEKMERILFNLLSNAFKFTPESGSVSIEAELDNQPNKKNLVIRIVDSGKGIPEKDIQKVFERFYQPEGRKENIGGTGIGLAFCKSLVDVLKGEIDVESEMNVRTCFSVTVPCGKSDELRDNMGDVYGSLINNWIPETLPVSDKIETAYRTDMGAFKILIIDDEEEIRELLYDEFGEQYVVRMAKNGQEGLKQIEEQLPDLILSDVMMPEMDGFELCRAVKTNPNTSHIPLILLTALGDKESEIKGLQYGADDFISKPFSIKHLQVRIEKLIENMQRLKNYFEKNSILPDTSIDISSRDKDFLNKIIDSMDKNLSDSQFGVEELAADIGLSTSQFYRRLKQLTGQIPNAYLRNYRLQKAAQLLRENKGLTVSEIMYEVGFESNSYFSAAFKKLHGKSPSDFLKKK